MIDAGGTANGSNTEASSRDFGGLTVDTATIALQSQSGAQKDCPVVGSAPSSVDTMQCALEPESPGGVCASRA
jgi:hypothetical protein